MVPDLIRLRLDSVVARYDEKQSRKPHHNPYALPQYLERVDAIMADIASGATPRQAVIAGFTGPVQDACLHALGEPPATTEEQSPFYVYVPASKQP